MKQHLFTSKIFINITQFLSNNIPKFKLIIFLIDYILILLVLHLIRLSKTFSIFSHIWLQKKQSNYASIEQ